MLNLLLFLSSVTVLVFLVLTKPQAGFLLLLSGLMLFYAFFLQGDLLSIGSAKLYPSDLVMVALLVYLLVSLLHRRLRVTLWSAMLFLVLFLWELFAIARGLPRYGYSAVGEGRWYALPMLYYFYVLVVFRRKAHVRRLVKWFLWLVPMMLVVRFVDYYLLSGLQRVMSELWVDHRTIFRFVNTAEVLLVTFAFVSLTLFYAVGAIKRHGLLLLVLLGAFVSVIVITQHRSVWLAVAAGAAITTGLLILWFVLKGLPLQGVLLGHVVLLFLLLAPFWVGLIGTDITARIAKSAAVFANPTQDPTGSWRLLGWRQELEKAVKQPFFGDGLGGYSEWWDGQRWQRVAIHNGYIMHFSKFGIVGLILLFAALVIWYAEMRRYARSEEDRYYRLIGYALQICVATHLVFAVFYDFTIFFWILLAAGAVLAQSRGQRTAAALAACPAQDHRRLVAF